MHKNFLFLSFIIAFTSAASANSMLINEVQKTICTYGAQTRVIEVVYLGAEDIPCEVHYTKDTGTNILWTSQNVLGYCEAKAVEFVAKQQSWGWTCSN